MTIDYRFTTQPVRPHCPQLSRAQKATMAVVAVFVSSTLLVGMLSLFEMHREEAAMARAPLKAAPSTDGLAVRKVGSAPRG